MVWPARRVLVVANPCAGFRSVRAVAWRVRDAIARRGLDTELVWTEGPGDAERIASRAGQAGFDVVFALGGDGTVHEVANGAAGTGVLLGVAPRGSMNLLARVLGLPLDPVAAVEAALDAGKPVTVRPGQAGDRLFVLMASAGVDSWVLRELRRTVRGKIGFRHYVAGALRGAFTYPYPEIRLELPGGSSWRSTSFVLGRANLYGGFLRPTPNVCLEDDTLELCAFSFRSASETIRILPLLWSGAHAGRPDVRLARVRSVEAWADRPDLPVQLDGELSGRLPMRFGVSSRSLTIVY